MNPVRLASDLFASDSRSFPVRLWDGTVLPPARDAGVRGTVVLRTPHALEALLPPAAERRVAEAILDGDLELEGDAIGLIEAAARWTGPRLAPSFLASALAAAIRRLPRPRAAPLQAAVRGRRHTVERDREAVRHHYDVSDDFYRLFLDDAMVYSCAYFGADGARLEDAQRAKLDLVCRKLGLSAGERFLDIGCGWGALIEHAAGRYGARALGITVSANQLAAARARVAALGGRAEVDVREDDYRTLRVDAPFDKVASVGMMEHVGRARLDEYFARIHRLLRPGGLFLNHAIAHVGGERPTLPWASQHGGGFIWRYVFPDGELVHVAEVVAAAERAGFEVRDLECLREHYAETLAAWLARLEARYDQAVAIAGERRARLYRLYLASSAVGFRIGRTSVYQLLAAKRTASGRAEGLPRCRGDWYPDAAARRSAPRSIQA